MGACQSVGGSATSGRGLNGAQVASALRCAIDAQRRRMLSREEEQNAAAAAAAEAALSPGNVRSPSQRIKSVEALTDSSYTEVSTEHVKCGCAAGTDAEADADDIAVGEFAPDVFRYLRQLEGVREEEFIDEWTLPTGKTDMALGEGRSMAMFLKSNNMDFMCKTISEVEVDVLMGILKEYTAYLAKNPDSMLMRFLMLLRVSVGDEVGYILCFSDIFSQCDLLNERWDIKGRKPKPGKYRHFPKFTKGVDRFGVAHEASSVVFDADDDKKKDTLVTNKDKDLTRMFWMPQEDRHKLLAQLESDFNFLGGGGLMDYSILVGVKYNDDTAGDSLKMKFALGEENHANRKEVRPSATRPTTAVHNANSIYHQGIQSIEGRETYYLGIIDMLTVYNGKKKSANFFKQFLWKADTLSTIPPPAYQKRISKFTKRIFPEVVTVDE